MPQMLPRGSQRPVIIEAAAVEDPRIRAHYFARIVAVVRRARARRVR